MKTIKGPGVFIAQFLREEEPYNNLNNISKWVTDMEFPGNRFGSIFRALDTDFTVASCGR